MARDGFFTGLDIGTSSIKVLVAEFIDGSMNVIGVSNVKSSGVKDGIIVDIDAAAKTIKTAIEQAEEKAGIVIEQVNVGLPANLLQIEPTQGMIPVTSESKELKDEDVESVVRSALTKSMTPILHNLRKTVERAGIQVENIIISPLAMTRAVLNEGEREFGATVIDMGGGQTTVASMRAQELQFTNIYSEGGEYITKDISKVLKTSMQIAEALKFNFGNADIEEASETETVQVEVVGENSPVEITEKYLAEIISARVKHILDRVKQDLTRGRLLDLPGGIVLVGGTAIMPGVVEVAQEIFETNVKLYVPNQVGIRNPMFANVISLVEYVGLLTEVDIIAQQAVSGEEYLRRKPIDNEAPSLSFDRTPVPAPRVAPQPNPIPVENTIEVPLPVEEENHEQKQKLGDRVRGIFGSMFD